MFSTEFEIAVLWVGASALAAMLSLAAMLLGLFLWQAYGRWRRERVLARWRPLFMACLYEEVASWPNGHNQKDMPVPLSPNSLPEGERDEGSLCEYPVKAHGSAATSVLELWRHLHDSLGAEQGRLLEQAAMKAGLPKMAISLLQGALVKNLCLGAEVSGRLKLVDAWGELIRLLAHPDVDVSSLAAIALSRIDTRRAAPVLVPMLADGARWQPVFGRDVAESLQGAEAEFSGVMLAPHQLEMLDAIGSDQISQALNEVLDAPKDDEQLSTALRLSKTPSLLEKIHPHAGHSQWFVRVQAANAIGRLGSERDVPFLLPMLGDASWWVRYRASGALSGLLGRDLASMEQIRGNQADPFARDMLQQVIAEIALSGEKP
ncbi:MAG: HEAT repeat domain-containing protein [Sulfuricellaceae bacterium]|nr:HEAT repeat domain-containing protein [Sulfuricellaceae bacterium]